MMMVFGPVAGVIDRRYGPKVPMTIGTARAALALPSGRARREVPAAT